ncbi:MAG: YggT family protein [Peptococcaceae bacterium]|nr:MAG: YggT family protein [Peptococcaceae bacterium]
MGIIFNVVNIIFDVYTWLLIIRIILSWIRHNPYQPVFRFIYEITDPYLNLFRRIIPPLGMFDLSPLVAFFVLQIIRQLVNRILFSFF